MPATVPSPPPRAPKSPAEEAKNALRASILASRARRTDDRGAAFAAHGLELAAGHASVALYASVGDEPDTWPLVDALLAGDIRVLLPMLAGRRTPDWAWYAGRDALRPGRRGILEPTTPALGAPGLAEASLVFCSALAATPRGERLGTGGGWYDRALGFAAPGAVCAAMCFDDEVLDAVPTDPWDRRVGVLVTDARVLWAST